MNMGKYVPDSLGFVIWNLYFLVIVFIWNYFKRLWHYRSDRCPCRLNLGFAIYNKDGIDQ